MTFLEWTYYGNTLRAWITALLAAGALFVVFEIAKGMLLRRRMAVAGPAAGAANDVGYAVVARTHVAWLALAAAYLGSRVLFFPVDIDARIRSVVVVAFCIQGAIWGVAAVEALLRRIDERQPAADPATAGAVRFLGVVGRAGVWTVCVLLALANIGVRVGPLLVGLGVCGLAAALALRPVLGDLFAALAIALDRPFGIGDRIVVGELTGTVEHVGLKTTRLRGEAGEQIVVSNADLLRSRIRNFERMRERRVAFLVGVAVGTPTVKLERIPALIQDVVESQEGTRFGRAHFRRIGRSSLDFEVVYDVLVPDVEVALDTRQSIQLELMRRFEEEGIEVAAPVGGADADVPAAVPAGGAD
ncbi:MAG TPA: mechanosensitive ion channel family protein [Longimicrobiales bacterium]